MLLAIQKHHADVLALRARTIRGAWATSTQFGKMLACATCRSPQGGERGSSYAPYTHVQAVTEADIELMLGHAEVWYHRPLRQPH